MLPGPPGPHSPQGSAPHEHFEPGQTVLFIGDHTSPDDPGYVGVISTVLGRFHPLLKLFVSRARMERMFHDDFVKSSGDTSWVTPDVVHGYSDGATANPSATLDAFRDHGVPRASLQSGLEEAREVMSKLASCGISMIEVTDTLVTQGVKLFSDAFEKLLSAIKSHGA